MKPNTPCNATASQRKAFATIALAIAAPLLALAESLAWNTTTQQFQANFDDQEITANYAFTNTSDHEVVIVETSATCGCTVPTLEKKSYAPGEKGELKAVFTIGSRQGKQRKVITVVTKGNGDQEESYELKLEVDIPVPVTFKPRVRFWKVQEETTSQEILVNFHPRMPMTLETLALKNPKDPDTFDYEIQALKAGLQYKITFRPKTPNEKSRATFNLVSPEDENNILKRYPIYLYVR